MFITQVGVAPRSPQPSDTVGSGEECDPKQARGLDGALLEIAQRPYGEFLLGVVAAGLIAYGLYCFVQARYRRI